MTNIKVWIIPLLFLCLCLLIISYIVTLKYTTFENLTNPEKVDLLSYLKVLLKQSKPSTIWKDLSGNKNDFVWSNEPISDKGFITKNNKLYGSVDVKQITLVLKVNLIKDNNTDVNAGDIIANAKLNIENKDMTLHIPSTVKESFENIKDIISGDQTQDSLHKLATIANNSADILNKYPNKAKMVII